MMINRQPVFPTIFFETWIEPDICFKIIEEIESKQDEIRRISQATQVMPIADYSTDFAAPIVIESFYQEVVPRLTQYFKEDENLDLKISNTWVSAYTGPHGVHPMHIHTSGFKCKYEYSAILYLSKAGATDFFSTHVMTSESQLSVPSDVGKVVFFPSVIPHQYRADSWDGNTRYTLPFNCELSECRQ